VDPVEALAVPACIPPTLREKTRLNAPPRSDQAI
jgi:hypothetical protein